MSRAVVRIKNFYEEYELLIDGVLNILQSIDSNEFDDDNLKLVTELYTLHGRYDADRQRLEGYVEAVTELQIQ